MPGISSGSGNISPQSMAISSSPDSTSIMLSPISPSPPSGISRTAGSLAGGGDSTTLLFGLSVHRSIRAFWARTFPAAREAALPLERGFALQASHQGVRMAQELGALGSRDGL